MALDPRNRRNAVAAYAALWRRVQVELFQEPGEGEARVPFDAHGWVGPRPIPACDGNALPGQGLPCPFEPVPGTAGGFEQVELVRIGHPCRARTSAHPAFIAADG
jgi:hypothetical protein